MYTRGPQWGENYDTTLDGFNPFKAIGKLVTGAVKVAGGVLGLGSGGANQLTVTVDPGTGKPGLKLGAKAPATPVEQAQQAIASVPTGVWVAGGVAAVALMFALTRGRRR